MPGIRRALMPWLLTITDEGDAGGGNSAPGEDQDGPKPGPDATPVRDMTAEEQAAYWKHQARRHEERNKSMGDYAALKEKAARYDELEESLKTEQELAVERAREEGRRAASNEANEATARTLLEFALAGRGMGRDEIAEAIRPVSAAAFVTPDGRIDNDALLAYATRLAGPTAAPVPDMGQGHRGPGTGMSRAEEGRAAARRRYKLPDPA